MKTWQAQLGDATMLPAGIGIPHQACVVAADCTAAGIGPGAGSGCGLGIAGECDTAFEQQAAEQPTSLVFEIEACNPVQLTCGGTQALGDPVTDDGGVHYAHTQVLEVSAGFTGSATVVYQGPNVDTFFQEGDSGLGLTVPIDELIGLTVNVPLGSCCAVDPCQENVPRGCCPGPAGLWRQGVACPPAGPACAECFTDADCNPPIKADDDAGRCTTNTCQSNLCVYTPTGCWSGPGDNECCNPATGTCADPDDGDGCTVDSCSLGDSLGVPQSAPNPGGPCNDGNDCTYADTCLADGSCLGTDVIGEPCGSDTECQHGGQTQAAVCVDGFCDCQLEPNLSFVIDPGGKPDPNCFALGEKINVAIHVAAAARPINGGQFAIVYDPGCLDFVSISPVPPYNNQIMEIVDEGAGTIFYAVGIDLGAPDGPAGNADMATISFLKTGDCTECDLCFTDNNPLHTYLTDNDGQPVGVVEKCSKTIRQSPSIDVTGPETVKLKVGCNSAVGCVTWDAPTATSDCEDVELVCTGEHLESGCTAGNCCGGTRNGLPCSSNNQCPLGGCLPSATSGGCFPVGNTNFCCTASNSCGNTDQHCWTVTVNDATALDVEIQLSPTMHTKPGGGIVRCIEFEVFNNCVQLPLNFCEDVVFGGLFQLIGHFNGEIKIPSQVQPECITARDKLHTLRSCYLFGDDDCDADGVLHATFKGDPFFGGNWLIGGNLDGWKKDNPMASHDVIDILDFGQIVSQWLSTYDSNGDGIPDGNTPCPEDCHPDEANADINGDGVVDLLDYSFVSMNFLEDSKDCCCPGSASLGNTVGRTEISVAELIRGNLKELTVADLNHDGVVNLQDMAALMQGVRPTRQAPDREDGKGSSGSRSFNR
jgi:hypothetical protein